MEEYKNVIGFEGLYEISNVGNVKSFKCGKEKLLKQSFTSSGYLTVTFHKNGNQKIYLVHRLVAMSFISNPENKQQVNHINGIKTDNTLENLEWLTQAENTSHALKNGLMVKQGGRYKKPLAKVA